MARISLNARKQRFLALAALALTLILLLSMTGNHSKKPTFVSNESLVQKALPVEISNANNMVKDKAGNIDESKVKEAEELANIRAPVQAPGGDSSSLLDVGAKKPLAITVDAKHLENKLVDAKVVDSKLVSPKLATAEKAVKKAPVAIDSETGETGETKKSNAATQSGNKLVKAKEQEANKLQVESGLSKEESEKIVAETSGFNPAKEFKEILGISPVVIFSKSYCPYSKRLKDLLKNSYDITPDATIVELDLHSNGKELQAYIGEVSGRKTVPNLFVSGVSRGGSDEMAALHSKGKLLESLTEWAGPTVKVEKVNAPSNS